MRHPSSASSEHDTTAAAGPLEPSRIAASPRAGIGRLAVTVERLDAELRDAESTADARALVEVAKGILMERLRCSTVVATRQLEELARRSGLPVLELAADLVNEISNDVPAALLRGTGLRARADGGSASPSVRFRLAESGMLNAPDVQAAARTLQRQALEPLGATAVAIWALSPDGSLYLAGHAGFTAIEAHRWRHVPPKVATLARQALETRRQRWTTETAGKPIPSIGLPRGKEGARRVALPAELGGRLLGVLEICWPGPVEPFPSPVLRQLDALAELCAHTLDGDPADGPEAADAAAGPVLVDTALTELADGLLDSALVIRPAFDADDRVVDFVIAHANERFVDPSGRPRADIVGSTLLRAYPMAARAGALFERVEHVHASGEAFRAERMVVQSVIDGVTVSTTAAVSITRFGSALLLVFRLEEEAARLARLLQHAQRLGRMGGFEEDFVTGDIRWNPELLSLFGLSPADRPIALRDLVTQAHPDDAMTINRFLRAVLHRGVSSSAAFRLQRGDGMLRYVRVVAEPVIGEDGELLGVRGACQDISSQHWTEIALAATRDRLKDTEREIEERNRLALRLQRAIMPHSAAPIEAPGLRVAVRYRPAEKGDLVGGDWYDALVLPNDNVLLVVGDVAGHGIDAATEMVALRNALRGLAATGARPGQMLSWLNTVAYRLSGSLITATAVCGVFDPQDRTLRWAAAGHPPPLLVRGDEARVLSSPSGILLGAVSDAAYEEDVLTLEPRDTLLMYTDGLIERRGRPFDDSLEHLLSTVRSPSPDLGDRLDHMLVHSNSDTDDDTCLIGVELR